MNDYPSELVEVRRRCEGCGRVIDVLMDAGRVTEACRSWVCPGCRETMAEGLPEDKGPVTGDPD